MVEAGLDTPLFRSALLGLPPGPLARASFTVTFSPSGSTTRFRWVQLLLGVDTDGGGEPFGLVHLDLSARELWLYGDEGFFLGPVPVGTASAVLQNSLCAVNSASTNAAWLGTTLHFTVDLTFKRTCPVPYRLFLRCETDQLEDSGWMERSGRFLLNAWSAETPKIEPNSGSGFEQRFSLRVPDPVVPLGVARGWCEFLIAESPEANGEPFFFLHYDHAESRLWMYSSEAGCFLGPCLPGDQESVLESSACRLILREVRAYRQDGHFVLEAPVLLKEPMTGPKKLYVRTQDALGRDSGWTERGTWTRP